MQMIDQDKYTVFKSKDVHWSGDSESSNPGMYPALAQVCSDDALDGCFVIRLQDPFAAPALEAYAASIEAGLKAIDIVTPSGTAPVLDEGRHDHLVEIVDYVRDLAERSREMHGKIPD